MRIRVCISLPSLRLMTDFIVDPLVDFCVDVIGEIGYAGIFLLMLVESANIPDAERGDDAVRRASRSTTAI